MGARLACIVATGLALWDARYLVGLLCFVSPRFCGSFVRLFTYLHVERVDKAHVLGNAHLLAPLVCTERAINLFAIESEAFDQVRCAWRQAWHRLGGCCDARRKVGLTHNINAFNFLF